MKKEKKVALRLMDATVPFCFERDREVYHLECPKCHTVMSCEKKYVSCQCSCGCRFRIIHDESIPSVSCLDNYERLMQFGLDRS